MALACSAVRFCTRDVVSFAEELFPAPFSPVPAEGTKGTARDVAGAFRACAGLVINVEEVGRDKSGRFSKKVVV